MKWCSRNPYTLIVKLLFQLFLINNVIVGLHMEKVLASFMAEIGGGNYTYYSLHEMGEITIILTSIRGDADLYISSSTQHPDYLNYDLMSTTCGVDIVAIPASFKRPAGVGVYGHIATKQSVYKLVAVLNYTGNYSDNDYTVYSTLDSDSIGGGGKDSDGNFVSSFVWQILEVILKILAEVLL